jgi:hypothetical protein
MHKAGEVSFANVITFNMDEYVALPRDHPESYHSFMWTNFFKAPARVPPPTPHPRRTDARCVRAQHIDIKPENVHILDGWWPCVRLRPEVHALMPARQATPRTSRPSATRTRLPSRVRARACTPRRTLLGAG